MAADLGTAMMEHIHRGHVPGRSAELILVPKPHHYLVGEWDLATLGTDEPFMQTSHPNPWAYIARVPMIFYGPGYAAAGHETLEPVDIADLAPTYASLVGLDTFEAAGDPLDDIVRTAKPRPPKVIFTVVIDGGGWNALEEHPNSWPTIAELRREGTTYLNADIGSAPSITGALHATMGTGAYPINHGIPGNQMRDPEGEYEGLDPAIDTFLQNADPRYLEVPTISEVWDEAHGNKPIVGTVSYEGWHLGMIGHGAQRETGDRDIAVLWEAPDATWWVNEDYYELPDYLAETDLDKLEDYEAALDPRDGITDQTWFGHTLEEIQEPPNRPGTSAFARFTGDAVADIIRNEPLGQDDLTDFFWVEMKAPDFSGHLWNVEGPEQADVIYEVDRQIARFRSMLDRKVGRGKYLFALTADHGQQPLADLHGGWRVNSRELWRDVDARFGAEDEELGTGIVEKVTTFDIFLDTDRLADEDIAIGDIARYLATYTIADNIPEGMAAEDAVPEHRLDDTIFAGAFSTDYMQSLTPEKIQSFGTSDYDEGDFTIGIED